MLLINLNSLIVTLDLMLMVLISVAFLTLMERKILGYIQIRKGPNKVGMVGLFQPFSDAIKLFSKEMFLILKSNYMYYMISPIFSMMLMLMLWNNMPIIMIILNNEFGFMMLLCLLSMGVYSMMIAGWSSNSMYSLVGSIRSIAQTISYEVSMVLLLLAQIFLIESFNMYMYMEYQIYLWFLFMNIFSAIMLLISFLAELNRTPFDFAEGESELVSGFNTEYMSGSFALIFIAEYGMIIFMMYLFSLIFLGGNISKMYFYLLMLMMCFIIIWIRGTYPRFRYDNLMYLVWKTFLPVSLNILMLVLLIKFII